VILCESTNHFFYYFKIINQEQSQVDLVITKIKIIEKLKNAVKKQKVKYNLRRIVKPGIFLILGVLVFLFYAYFSQAQIPDFVNYQGRLRDSAGNPITTPTTIQFSLYSHPTNGSPTDTPSASGPLLWTETYDGSGGCAQITPGADGIFAQHLGSCVPFPAYLDFTQEYYLGVKIGGDAEATPRVPLSSHPYAFTAKRLYTDGEDINITTVNSGNIVLRAAIGIGNILLHDTNDEVGTAGQLLSATGNGVDWVDASSLSAGSLWDADTDTGIQVEESADEDIIRFDTSGLQRVEIDNAGNFLVSDFEPVSLLNPGGIEGLLFRDDKYSLLIGTAGSNEWDDANVGLGVFSSGRYNIVSGNYSTALGGNNDINDVYSVALGRYNTITSSYSVAGGYHNTASGYASTVFGQTNQATDRRAMAWGLDNIASQDEATAWGRNTRASGDYATSWGRDSVASGELATAFGYQNTASQQYATAFGYQNTVSGRYATAWGGQNTASGQYATAWGSHNTASGAHSTAIGYYSEASAENATAIGDVLANSNYMTAIGRFNENVSGQSLTNWVDTDQLFVIGNGTSWQNADRSNALTILKNGSMTINAPIDGAVLTQQPSGNVDLAIATIGYVNAQIASASPWERDAVNGYIYQGDLNDLVGIGTSTPSDKLTVYDGNLKISQDAVDPKIILEGRDQGFNWTIGQDEADNVQAGFFYIGQGANVDATNAQLLMTEIGHMYLDRTHNLHHGAHLSLMSDGTNSRDSIEFIGLASDTRYPELQLYRAKNNSAAEQAVAAEDILGQISFIGNSGSNPYAAYNYLRAIATESWTNTARGGEMQFFTSANGTTTALKRLIIENDGTLNVGDTIDYENLVLDDDDIPNKRYVDEQLMWEIVNGGERIQPKNNSVRQVYVQEDSNSYTQFMVRNNNDTGNGAGAIIELKGSGADYTNNMYIGKYGASFWIPELQDNGAVLTDKNLVIGTASSSQEIHFVTGNSYTDLQPVVVADNEGFRYTSDLSATFVDRTLVDKAYVDGAISSSSPTFQDVVDQSLAVDGYVYANMGAGEIEDDGGQLRTVAHSGFDFVFGTENMLTFNFNGGTGSAKIDDYRTGTAQVGIEYEADYSANYTNRSLVDKEYVDEAMVFVNDGGTIYNGGSTSSVATDDFVFGSSTLDYSTEANRMFFDKSKGAFRAGQAGGTEWDDANVGNYSTAFGRGNIASGFASFVAGQYNQATSFGSIIIGNSGEASGVRAAAIGNGAHALGNDSVAIGGTTAYSFNEITVGTPYGTSYTPNSVSAWDADDRLFVVSNGYDSNNRSDALIIYKNGLSVFNNIASYEADYSANYTSRSLVDKAYVDSRVGNSIFDTDADTGVQAEANPDEDYLRMQTAGTERVIIDNQGRVAVNKDSWASLDSMLQVGPGTHEASIFSVAGDANYYNIATFRDEDGENIFRAKGSLANDNLIVTFGDWDWAYDHLAFGLNTDTDSLELYGGAMRFYEYTGGQNEYVGFKAPTDVSANTIWTLPVADGTSGQVLQTDGAGNLSWGSVAGGSSPWIKTGTNLSPATVGDDVLLNTGETLTISDLVEGSVLFAGTGGLLSQDNTNFFWDNANKRLGIGTTAPATSLDVVGGNIQTNSALVARGTSNGGEAAHLVVNAGASTLHRLIQAENNNGIHFVVNGNNGVGVVGIGLTNPQAALHVRGDSGVDKELFILHNTTGYSAFFETNTNPEGNITADRGDIAIDGVHGDLYIKNVNDNTTNGWVRLLEEGDLGALWDTDGDTGIQVEESADEDMIRFDTGGSQRMLLKDNGLLTVDTETSDFDVAVFGTSHAKITVNQDDVDMAGINLMHIGNDDYPARIAFTKARGTVGNESSVQDGDEIGEISSIAYDGTRYITSGGLSIRVDGAPATNNIPTKLVFLTTNSNAIGSSEKMVLNNAGNLGINTDNPTYKLTVVGDGSALTEGSLELATYADGGIPSGIYLHRARGTEDAPSALTDGMPMGGLMTGGYDGNSMVAYSAGITMEATEDWTGSGHGTQLNFLTTENGTGAATTKMVLSNEGNLGVNISNPEYTITVGGAIMLDGTSIPTASQGFAGIYTNNGELYALDENGNSTQLSPHNKDGLWWYNSTNVETGKTLQIEMETLTKDINKLLGGGYITENGVIIDQGSNVIEELRLQTKTSELTLEKLKEEVDDNIKDSKEKISELEKIGEKIQETIKELVEELKNIWIQVNENEDSIQKMREENDDLRKELCKKDDSYSWCDKGEDEEEKEEKSGEDDENKEDSEIEESVEGDGDSLNKKEDSVNKDEKNKTDNVNEEESDTEKNID